MLYELLKSLLFSAIFYLIVVYVPNKNENNIAKNFIIKQYNRTRASIVNELLWHLEKTNVNKIFKNFDNNYLEYEAIREAITDEDIEKFRNFDPHKFYTLNKKILYELDILKSTLAYTLSCSFLRGNKESFERFNYLIQWINQFNYSFNTDYRENDELEYSKLFCKFIDEHVRGICWIKGKIDKDNFIEIIEQAYENSLLVSKLKRLYTLSGEALEKLYSRAKYFMCRP